MSPDGKPIVKEIRARLERLCNVRERAYRKALESGFIIPHLAKKNEAIRLIRIQLSASEQWNLRQTINMVNGLGELIETILPEASSRTVHFRREIVSMVRWCFDQSIQPQNEKAA